MSDDTLNADQPVKAAEGEWKYEETQDAARWYKMELDELNKDWKPGTPINYIRDREDISSFVVPEPKGKRYEVEAPDTLDLQQRASWMIHGMTEITDAQADHEMYFDTHLNTNPLAFYHHYSDQVQSMYMEGLPLLRLMSGSTQNMHVEADWIRTAMQRIGPDNFVYDPIVGRPWVNIGAGYYGADSSQGFEENDSKFMGQMLMPFYACQSASALLIYYKLTGEQSYLTEATKMVEGLIDLAITSTGTREDLPPYQYAYYSPSILRAQKGSTYDLGKQTITHGVHICWAIMTMVHFHREIAHESGDTRAIDLARKLLHYQLHELNHLHPNGRFGPDMIREHPEWAHLEFHGRLMLCMIEFGKVTGENHWIEWAKRGYEYAKSYQSGTYIGHFPEIFNYTKPANLELCGVLEMIAIGSKLSAYGFSDEWDHIDRWVRNAFADSQLTPHHCQWFENNVKYKDVTPFNPIRDTQHNVGERMMGLMSSSNRPNHWGAYIMNCCTATTSRALYYLWEHMIEHDGKTLSINLLLNAPSEWVDIESSLPHQGLVRVTINKSTDLALRLPEWCDKNDIHILKNGQKTTYMQADRSLRFQSLKPSDVIEVRFDVPMRKVSVEMDREEYTVSMRGNEVYDISFAPQGDGTHLRTFHRPHLKKPYVTLRTSQRFVPNTRTYW